MLTPSSVLNNNENVNWRIVIKNTGAFADPSVVTTLTIPLGLTFTGSLPSKGTYDSIQKKWFIGSLAIGEEVTLQINLSVNDILTAPFMLVATVTGVNFDPVLGNNTLTEVLTLAALPAPPCPIDIEHGCVCGTVALDSVQCVGCETNYEVVLGSIVNGTLIYFNAQTGEYRFKYTDISSDGAFDYKIKCINCIIGADTISTCQATVVIDAISSGTTVGSANKILNLEDFQAILSGGEVSVTVIGLDEYLSATSIAIDLSGQPIISIDELITVTRNGNRLRSPLIGQVDYVVSGDDIVFSSWVGVSGDEITVTGSRIIQ